MPTLNLGPEESPADYDPCPRQTQNGELCGLPRYHRGQCSAESNAERIELYQVYADHLRELAATMTRSQLRAAAEFHRLAWRVLTGEINAR